MAASSHPTRSVSFPSRSNVNVLRVQETLTKLKSRDSGVSAVQESVLCLVELYGQVQELMLLPSSSQYAEREFVEAALEISGWLIDSCSRITDLILRLKEQVRDLQSALRRKGHFSVESEIRAYMCLRKKLGRDVARWVKEVKQAEGILGMPDLDPFLALLKEVYAVTISVFKSVFIYLSVPTKTSKWSVISQLVMKRAKSEPEELCNEVTSVDVALHGVHDVSLVRERIEALDASIVILEGELECLSRCLVRNRVSLLNILTP
ncbi:uncharacterized protein LOC141621152 [Silene latifolia]|uniref:uncharacterized protein LOC141621152 n=1 Tax=Silene latifolia TaxID=37657 RepID=UPI003D78531D